MKRNPLILTRKETKKGIRLRGRGSTLDDELFGSADRLGPAVFQAQDPDLVRPRAPAVGDLDQAVWGDLQGLLGPAARGFDLDPVSEVVRVRRDPQDRRRADPGRLRLLGHRADRAED